MKRLCVCLLLLCLLVAVPSCQKAEKAPFSQTFFVMDTFLTITLYEGDDPASLAQKANAIAVAIEQKASRTLQSSEVSAFNEAEKSYTFSPEMASLIQKALTMSEATNGAYDITVAPLVDLWQIKEGGPVPSDSAIEKALAKVGYQKLSLVGNTLMKSEPEVKIDLGSLAKGYALGEMASFFDESGCVGIVNFGGNVALVGEKTDGTPWRVSLRDPFDENKTSGTFTLSSGVVAVSGDYERYFEENGTRYHHILSPFDGKPVQGVHSVAIVAEDATQADMLSTALFVMGKEKAAAFAKEKEYDFDYVMTLSPDQTVVGEGTETIYTP